MQIFSNTSIQIGKEDLKSYVFPYNDQFLEVGVAGKLIAYAVLKNKEDIKITHDLHFFSLGSSFNLLPDLSDEMLDEKALTRFLDWNLNQKLFRNKYPEHHLEIQFQTDPIQYVLMNNVNSATHFHHFTELKLRIPFENGVSICVFNQMLVLRVIQEQQLLLVNLYKVKNLQEVLYYTLLIYQELDLSAEDTKLICFGDAHQEIKDLQKEFKAYIRNVESKVFGCDDPNFSGILGLISATL